MRCTLVPMSGVGSPVDPAPTPEHVAFASRLSGNWVHLVRFTPPQLRYVTFVISICYFQLLYVGTFSLLGEKGEGVVFSRPLRALRAA